MPRRDESLGSEIDDEANGSGYRFKRLLETARLEAEIASQRLRRNVLDTSMDVFADELTMEPMNIQEVNTRCGRVLAWQNDGGQKAAYSGV